MICFASSLTAYIMAKSTTEREEEEEEEAMSEREEEGFHFLRLFGCGEKVGDRARASERGSDDREDCRKHAAGDKDDEE